MSRSPLEGSAAAARAAASQNPQRWRFTWEALAHIPTLRLYLFDSILSLASRCRNLGARLRLDESLLLVSWVEGVGVDQDVHVRVPIPRVLIDPGCLVDCAAKDDHIEVKLALVLPIDNPIVADICSVFDSSSSDGGAPSDRLLPLELGSDLRSLASGTVNLFCKFCSTKLTKQPIRKCVEVPSVNWLEAADNWFGSCCCSFGDASEKLVSRYTSSYDCVEGSCMLGDASVIVCKDDLEGCSFQQCSSGSADCGYEVSQISNHVTQELKRINLNSSVASSPKSLLLSRTDSCGNAEVLLSRENKYVYQQIPLNDVDGDPYFQDHGFMAMDQFHCCTDGAQHSSNHGDGQLSTDLSKHPISQLANNSQNCLRNNFLGCGFMIRASDLSKDVKWVEFLCSHCSSMLGSYPTIENRNVPVDGGIRLFKCNISTDFTIGGASDIFRKYTLQRTFVSLLSESAANELSFRVVVKDLETKSPMLLVVLLNSKAWRSTGYCFEDVLIDHVVQTALHPIAKVAFRELCGDNGSNSWMVEDWLARHDLEEMYMMADQIRELTACLYSSLIILPPSCSSFQGMSLSSMER